MWETPTLGTPKLGTPHAVVSNHACPLLVRVVQRTMALCRAADVSDLDRLHVSGLVIAELPVRCMAVRARVKSGQWDLAFQFLVGMAPVQGETDTIIYSATVFARVKSGQWDLAVQLLMSMASAHGEMDTIKYSSTVSTCA